MLVKNITNGPKGLNAMAGQVVLEPGETADIEISDDELKASKATKWFAFAKDAEKADKAEAAADDEVAKLREEVAALKAANDKLKADADKAEAAAKATATGQGGEKK